MTSVTVAPLRCRGASVAEGSARLVCWGQIMGTCSRLEKTRAEMKT